jgi:hypothetical protein
MAQPDFSARNKLAVLVRERKDALSVRWMVATTAIAGYALLLAAVARDLPDELPWAVTVACWLAGAVLAVLAIVLPQRRLTDKELKRHLQRPVESDVLSKRLRLDAEQSRMLGELPASERRAYGLVELFAQPHLLGLGLSGGLALVGLGYGIATRGLIEAAPFLLGALALNCWHFPRLAKLVDRGLRLASADEDALAQRTLARLEERERRGSQRPPASRPPPRPQPSTPPPRPGPPGPRPRKR